MLQGEAGCTTRLAGDGNILQNLITVPKFQTSTFFPESQIQLAPKKIFSRSFIVLRHLIRARREQRVPKQVESSPVKLPAHDPPREYVTKL